MNNLDPLNHFKEVDATMSEHDHTHKSSPNPQSHPMRNAEAIAWHLKQIKRAVCEIVIDTQPLGQLKSRQDVLNFVRQFGLESSITTYLEGMLGFEDGKIPESRVRLAQIPPKHR